MMMELLNVSLAYYNAKNVIILPLVEVVLTKQEMQRMAVIVGMVTENIQLNN